MRSEAAARNEEEKIKQAMSSLKLGLDSKITILENNVQKLSKKQREMKRKFKEKCKEEQRKKGEEEKAEEEEEERSETKKAEGIARAIQEVNRHLLRFIEQYESQRRSIDESIEGLVLASSAHASQTKAAEQAQRKLSKRLVDLAGCASSLKDDLYRFEQNADAKLKLLEWKQEEFRNSIAELNVLNNRLID